LTLKPQGDGANADLNELAGRINLIAWPYTSPEVVPDVQATWESFCEIWTATNGCGPSMAVERVAATGSPGYSCEAESRPCRSPLLVVYHIKTLSVAAWQEKGGSQCSKMSLFSSLPRWRLRCRTS